MGIFTPFLELGLKNRTVMAPMTRYSCSSEGMPTDKLSAYYLRRAKHGVGLIVTESAAINGADAMGYRNGLQFHSQAHSDAWKPIIQDIHSTGAKIWLQLFHAGRLTVPAISHGPSLSASALAPLSVESFWRPKLNDEIVHFQTNTVFEEPKEMSVEQIATVIESFATSCRLAEEAGFDGVELHGAHGYLLHQFSCSETNIRADKYCSNDFELLKLLVSECRKAVGKTFTLSYRLSLHRVDNNFVRYNPADFDFSELVKLLDSQGIDVFHVSELSTRTPVFGGRDTLHNMVRQSTDKPVIACGRIESLDAANGLVDSGEVDLVAFGRAFISNPDLIELLQAQREDEMVAFSYDEHMADIF